MNDYTGNAGRTLARAGCALAGLTALLGGCAAVVPTAGVPQWEPIEPRRTSAPPTPVSGAIYAQGQDLRYFEDVKARRVGDILTIALVERTDARKSASTATSRESELNIPTPTLAGGPVPRNGRSPFNNEFETSRSFNGQGDSAQSNSLNGAITVTVVEVRPNGNLLVQGEKWIQINQGHEFIRLTGIVRAADVQTDNTVESSKVADARIAYSGRGSLARANTQGWLSRLFNSPVFPL